MAFQFNEENITLINEECKKYPEKKPVVMFALYRGQEQNGYISKDVMDEVAKVLEMDAEDVYGVVSFYTMYHTKPIGKYHLQVCTNVSCMLRGGYDIMEQVKQITGINNGEVSSDMKFSIEEVECMGSCGTAPMIAVNEDFHENLNTDKVKEIIQTLK